ncbi:Cro/Cl family transcriptional regulator [Shewanella sp. Choline-02u-19]|uniref:Cro/CI family transcriptional regulator n=1 Tax=unclassified Shewanella TaxID=196818 RepID=UPI000C32D9F5|nr:MULTISPECIES: Cro/CI family transcriptional regulator [unclassified Shewanella]PKH62183.1 Cro/Cl family transcriptional regulator [Shewanella sp. Bg11-22]PKI27940.1 Cro/Cl family transcriptional regulator [Shewanella sp. Choline-02u-19]
MKKVVAIDYFGSQVKLAAAIGVSQAAISKWGDDVPALRAFQIERLTHGALQVNAVVIDNTKSVSVA